MEFDNDSFNTQAVVRTARTGVISGFALSINVDDTKFDIAAGVYQRVNYVTGKIERVSVPAITGITGTLIASSVGTWLRINPDLEYTGANIVQSPYDVRTLDDVSTKISIGRLGHFLNIVLTGHFDYVIDTTIAPSEALKQKRIGTTKRPLNGEVPFAISANGANMKIDMAPGIAYRIGAGASIDNLAHYTRLHEPTLESDSQVSFLRAYNNGSDKTKLDSPTTDINPDVYDDGDGTLGTVGNAKWTNKYVLMFPNITEKTVFMLQGKVGTYGSLANAEAALGTNADIEVLEGSDGGVILAGISVKEGTTNLTTAISGGEASITQTDDNGEFN